MGEPSPEDAQSQPDEHGGSGSGRPDWLVGADEGVEAESKRAKPAEAGPPPPLKLTKPTTREEPEAPARPAPRPAPTLSQPAPEAAPLELSTDPAGTGAAGGGEAPRIISGKKPAEARPPKPVPWTAAASSVPALRAARATPPPALSVVPGGAPSQRPAPDAARARPVPEMVEPRWVESPEPAARPEEAELEFPDDAVEPEPAGVPRATRAPVAPPREEWWVVALDAVRSDVRIHIALGVVAVAIAAFCVWPRAEKGASLSAIRHNPDRFDGARVFVRGKVGEVFGLGGGYAFYLHQGRDTLVVFTRGAMPQTRKQVAVKGTIQTGFLDGAPRQALFADPD